MQRGEVEGMSCREEQREGSHAERRRRGREVMQRGAEGGESCRKEDKREGSHAGWRTVDMGVMQRGAEGR
jgi:hypothetical protein